jgi:transcriptional regulator
LYESEDVPTWDYMSVHCEVEIHIPSNTEAVNDLHALVHYFEKGLKEPIDPANFSKAMMDGYLKYVHPFRMKILKMEAAWKLSQNRNETEKNSIREFLKTLENPLWKEI